MRIIHWFWLMLGMAIGLQVRAVDVMFEYIPPMSRYEAVLLVTLVAVVVLSNMIMAIRSEILLYRLKELTRVG
jgi:hypothetical protein